MSCSNGDPIRFGDPLYRFCLTLLRPLSGLKLPDEVIGRGPVGLRWGTELDADRGDPFDCLPRISNLILRSRNPTILPFHSQIRYYIVALGPSAPS